MVNQVDAAKSVGDGASFGVLLAAWLEWLPEVAALLTIIWTTIRIIESETVQRWLRRRRDR